MTFLQQAIEPLPSARKVSDLRGCLSPASFWQPEQLGPQPGWVEHAPFAFWLVEALRPRLVVELGTHGGYSYFSLCQAVQRFCPHARCHAIDTWAGDEHSGFYGEEVYEAVRARNSHLYAAFSTLIRSTFDEALRQFDEGSIDLLHIDGRHRLADVRHDFETWRPKLSDRAVVLFHDTGVREADFGVWQFWAEISDRHPHFEFVHANGLGVLGVGRHVPEPVSRLFAAMNDDKARMQVREAYVRLGRGLSLQILAERQDAELARRSDEATAAEARAAAAEARVGAAHLRAGQAEARLEARSAELERCGRELSAAQQRELQLHGVIAELRASTSWRVTAPLRWLRRLLG